MSEQTRTVVRAIDVLLSFSNSEPELTLTEISAKLGIHKSTLHRLLGTRLLELALLVSGHNDLQRRARPYLYRLADECQETADLSILDNAEVVYLEVVESPQRVKLAARPGQRLPAHSTASGKAFLAHLPASEMHAILPSEFARYTEGTLASKDSLLRDLQATRERGFAMSIQEHEAGINAVAAPVLDATGYPIAVVAVAGPSFRLTSERMLEIAPLVRVAADAIAGEVGSVHGLTAIPNAS
jgi:DNA-binding IclR family transcriptional regulator